MKYRVTEDFKKLFKALIIYFVIMLIGIPAYHLIIGDFSWADTFEFALMSFFVTLLMLLIYFFGSQIPEKKKE